MLGRGGLLRLLKSLFGAEKLKRDERRALVVDDDDALGSFFQLVLTNALPQLAVDRVKSGREAIDVFSRGHHGLLLMDLHMPRMDGRTVFDTVFNICKKNNWEMPSVVFCTGYAPPQVLRRCLADRRHCLLRKPVAQETLIREVRRRLKVR
jgi:CheY-like chemotaxis protein